MNFDTIFDYLKKGIQESFIKKSKNYCDGKNLAKTP